MARIEPIPFAEWSSAMREAITALVPESPRYPLRSGKNRPRAENALGTLAHHPRLARAFFGLNGHLMTTTTLSERQRELLIMRVAAVRESSYEWAQHYFISREIGLDAETIARIAFGPNAPLWEPIDAALLRAVDELIEEGAITRLPGPHSRPSSTLSRCSTLSSPSRDTTRSHAYCVRVRSNSTLTSCNSPVIAHSRPTRATPEIDLAVSP